MGDAKVDVPTPELASDAAPPDAMQTAARLAALMPRLIQALSTSGVQRLREISGQDYSLIDYGGLTTATARFWLAAWSQPARTIAAQADLMRQWWDLVTPRPAGANCQAPAQPPARQDKRFADRRWQEEPGLRLLKDSYLLYCDWLVGQIAACDALSEHERRKLTFYARQKLSELSPANVAAINPVVWARAVKTNGASLVDGLANLVEDLETGKGMLPIAQNDRHAFQVGRDLALTPGKVVYRNDLMELIQYAPRTDTVHRRPLLFVPPWINKYYILDLSPANSLFRWLLDQGHTVFVISWANPKRQHADKSFEHYMHEGPLAAIDVVRQITGEEEINLGAFCIGGILTVCTLAYLAALENGSGRKRPPVRSATFLATMLDLSSIGEASVFIDDAQLANIEKHTQRTGYLDGYHMKDMFSLLRENDLVWNYVVSNYLLGRSPPAFDILHWNGDSTRLPARMLTDFLRGIYIDNSLIKPGALTMGGQPIDIGLITTPSYFLSTVDDHIAPWTATYPAVHLLGGPAEFVLGGSGHIAGIVNPPTKTKYGFRTAPKSNVARNGKARAPDSRSWLAIAERHDGSWWPHWGKWLARHGGGQVAARPPGSAAFPPLADAPGTYVLEV